MYDTTTTDRLEALARRLGLKVICARSDRDSAGRYFARGYGSDHWVSLGWSGREAETRLRELAALEEMQNKSWEALEAEYA